MIGIALNETTNEPEKIIFDWVFPKGDEEEL